MNPQNYLSRNCLFLQCKYSKINNCFYSISQYCNYTKYEINNPTNNFFNMNSRFWRLLPVFIINKEKHYFFRCEYSAIGDGGSVVSDGFPNHTLLLNLPFTTGVCHLLVDVTLNVGF